MLETLLTIDDLKDRWRLPKRSVYELAQKGRIPGALKIGKHWRFREDVIEKWIEKQTSVTKTTAQSGGGGGVKAASLVCEEAHSEGEDSSAALSSSRDS